MKILVFNSGSSSLKIEVVDPGGNIVYAACRFDDLNGNHGYYSYSNLEKQKTQKDYFNGTIEDAVIMSLVLLTDEKFGVYKSLSEIEGIGHRIVQGKNKYYEAVRITPKVLGDIKEYAKDAPIHNKIASQIIEICLEEIKNQNDNVGVFDSAFHNTMPEINYRYAIPAELYNDLGIRKYGFHGISYQNIMRKLPNKLNIKSNDINAVFVHLGSGCSMCCVKNGKSYDTTMGYSPLDGLMMSTRSGSIDPSIVSKICEYYKCDVNGAIEVLNNTSGYYGICKEKDIKTVCDLSENGNKDAMLAREMASQSFKKNLGAMISQLDSLDAIVVTGGMGVKNPRQRKLFLSDLDIFGVSIDVLKNQLAFDEDYLISDDKSKIPVYVIPSDEEYEIAYQTESVLRG